MPSILSHFSLSAWAAILHAAHSRQGRTAPRVPLSPVPSGNVFTPAQCRLLMFGEGKMYTV
jgi:hypothetical protein